MLTRPAAKQAHKYQPASEEDVLDTFSVFEFLKVMKFYVEKGVADQWSFISCAFICIVMAVNVALTSLLKM